jgi:two-component system sensor histidine kinase HydH
MAFILVLALVWAMVFRERATRRLYLEYEAYRASASLLDAFRETPGIGPSDSRVLGFAIYGLDGKALARSGTAPEAFDRREVGASMGFRAGAGSLVLARSIGPGAPGMPGMGRMQGMQGLPGIPRGMGRFNGGGPADPPTDPALQPRALWIEYGLAGFNRDQALLYGSASAASLALLALYAIFLVLSRRNADLAEREFQNRELVQLGEAARTLVHEIKNPLGIIRVQAASLRRLDPATAAAKAAEKGEAIDDEVLRLANLADRIREFLKGGEGEPEDLELGAWILDFAARYSGGEAGAEIELGDADASARARIDPERLSLALDNLVRNAREASPGGRPELTLAARGREWEISVADRGPGVAPELEGRLFEPFFTTKERGSGIGLALARRVARAAGGELEYRTRPGGGAVFSIFLPALRH